MVCCSSKLVYLDVKNIARFNQNSIQKLMSLDLASKSNLKWLKTRIK